MKGPAILSQKCISVIFIYALTLLIILCPLFISAQGISINNSNAPADASAILDISSLQKGVLFPRMNTGQRTAIANPAQGLMVYDTDSRSYWFFDNTWKEVAAGGPLTLPFAVSTPSNTILFDITNTSGTPGSAVIKGKQTNAGSGINIPLSIGVWGDNSNGGGVAGTSNSGIGTYGVSTFNHGIWGSSGSANFAGVYGTSIMEGGYGVLGEINQDGYAIYGKAQGTQGSAGYFHINNLTSYQSVVKINQEGKGQILHLTNTSNAGGTAMQLTNHGAGTSIVLQSSNPTTTNPAMILTNLSKGVGLSVSNQNAASDNRGISTYTAGTGHALHAVANLGTAGYFLIDNVNNANKCLESKTSGTGMSASFIKENITGNINDPHDPCVLVDNMSKGAGIRIINNHEPSINPAIDVVYGGDAYAMKVNSYESGIYLDALGGPNSYGILSQNQSNGIAIKGISTTNLEGAVIGENLHSSGYGIKGIGHGINGIGVIGLGENASEGMGSITGINTSNTDHGIAVYGESYASFGSGLRGKSNGPNGYGVYGDNPAGGVGVMGKSTGSTAVGIYGLGISDAGTSAVGIQGDVNGTGYGMIANSGNNGAGIKATSGTSNNGRGALLQTLNASNPSETVKIENLGSGQSFKVVASNNSNSSTAIEVTKAGTGNFIIFEAGNGDNKIRFDNTGKGFFNGGTQNSGADIAESFEVENEIESYEPGDVLVISLESDRTVTKSAVPYSTLVAGVYATKPGVLLTEHDIDSDPSDEIPMGVVGVIPTKVCIEGGAIQRGDFIVTSSQPGVAMKGDPEKVKIGQVIGKALENYDGEGTGKIKVLVSIK